jgi:hypothetical protein
MNKRDGAFSGAKNIALILSLLCIVLIIIVGLTDLGQSRAFRFLVGEVATMAAIAYSNPETRRMNKFTPLPVAVWLAIASIHFAQAVWFAAK